ncbi:hypothetical protein GCM10008967_19350 [Bacillus carboniphilus]|uniref:Uncharacterized protein n=1 Tax=Bacillus carboniphilus TaxID=86663 RepID=A0ABN0W8L7_9BACI
MTHFHCHEEMMEAVESGRKGQGRPRRSECDEEAPGPPAESKHLQRKSTPIILGVKLVTKQNIILNSQNKRGKPERKELGWSVAWQKKE